MSHIIHLLRHTERSIHHLRLTPRLAYPHTPQAYQAYQASPPPSPHRALLPASPYVAYRKHSVTSTTRRIPFTASSIQSTTSTSASIYALHHIHLTELVVGDIKHE